VTTDWFAAWATARHTAYVWPFDDATCADLHSALWQAIAPGLAWCRACYYHRPA